MSEQQRLAEIETSFSQLTPDAQRELIARLAERLSAAERDRKAKGEEWLKRVQEIRERIGPISGTTTDLIREIRER